MSGDKRLDHSRHSTPAQEMHVNQAIQVDQATQGSEAAQVDQATHVNQATHSSQRGADAMREYVIFLHPTDPEARRPIEVIRDHCRHLDRLDADGRLIAAGPFTDPTHGGMIVGRFSGPEDAEEYARTDPFVLGSYSQAEVRAWEWSYPENGHLGIQSPAPGGHPRFLDTLDLRSTTRNFSPRLVEPDLVQRLLRAALAAPSEFNLQPWRPIVCQTALERQRLERFCLDQPHVTAASLAVICAVDSTVFVREAPRAADEMIATGRRAPEERDATIAFIRSCYESPRESAIRNGTIFAHQLLLAAHSQGLAGFWLGGFDEAALRREFEMPPSAVVAGVIGLGWPVAHETPMPRLSLEDAVGWGEWKGAPVGDE
ncbi:MAG: nitroreductase family protein [Candidatus Eisenbacteria bacterium]